MADQSHSHSAVLCRVRSLAGQTFQVSGSRPVADKNAGVRWKGVSGSNGGVSERMKIQNRILLGLPPKERKTIASKLVPVQLPARTILTQMKGPIEFAYFLNSGVASIITVISDGKSVEVGLIGNEGFIGLPLIVHFATSPARAVIQIAGSGLRISALNFKSVLRTCPKLEKKLQRYAQELALQSVQIAVCNRLHPVNERLARWLLMSHDRIGARSLPLTQEFVAHMLGTRRASVTVAAGALHKAGLITYERGNVTIENRPGWNSLSANATTQSVNR
jgi:CRP-like cAMP-binding protein